VPHENGKTRTRLEAGFFHFGAVTLCLISQPWVTLGDLGWKWVDIGSRGRGGAEIFTMEARRHGEDLQNENLTADLRG
jgi:hypothetical protein